MVHVHQIPPAIRKILALGERKNVENTGGMALLAIKKILDTLFPYSQDLRVAFLRKILKGSFQMYAK